MPAAGKKFKCLRCSRKGSIACGVQEKGSNAFGVQEKGSIAFGVQIVQF